MIAVIRIKGMVGLRAPVVETLNRLRLRKKYACVVLEKPTAEQLGMIKKVRNFVAYGELNEETYKQLKEKRKTKIENFFRLHPPRGGIDAKKHFGVTNKAVLGDNKDKINELIGRML
jgi:ribosomal protein L30/L7E